MEIMNRNPENRAAWINWALKSQFAYLDLSQSKPQFIGSIMIKAANDDFSDDCQHCQVIDLYLM